MKAKILFFAGLRDKMKRSEGEYELIPGETLAELAHRILEPALGSGHFERALMFAVDNEYAAPDYRPRGGEEIAFLPPVAGG